MSAETTIERIAELNAQITGITTAFDELPESVEDAELPAALVRVGDAQHVIPYEGARRETRNYELLVLVMDAALGTEAEAENRARPFIARFLDFYGARPGLEASDDDREIVEGAHITADSGFVNGIPYANKLYAGVVFTLQVSEITTISYHR
jgi:hypothetical protein